MAAPRAYSGAWRNQTAYVDRALAPNPGVDPSHMHPDEPDQGSRAPSGGPPRTDFSPLYLTTEADDAYAFELDTPGYVVDAEETDNHDPGDPDVSRPPSPAHQIDRGRHRETEHAWPSMRAVDEQPTTDRFVNAPVSAGSTVSSLRGDNSLPDNNPEGFPTGTGEYGHLVWRRFNRRMPHEYRRHDERVLTPHTAAAATVSPVPDHANRYVSPFDWTRLYARVTNQRPVQRRDPRPWSEPADDGTAQAADEAFADWVVG